MSEKPSATSLTAIKRETFLEQAVSVFVGPLPEQSLPTDEALNNAARETERLIEQRLLQASAEDDESNKAGLVLELGNWIHRNPLPIPPLIFVERISGIKLALASAAGTLAGGLWISGLFKLLLPSEANIIEGTPGAGYIFGSLAGAAVTVLAVWYASESRTFKRYLQGFLGFATAAELLLFLGKLTSIGSLWSLLGRRFAGRGITLFFKRLLVYAGISTLLALSIRRPVFDRERYRQLVSLVGGQWLDAASAFVAQQMQRPPSLATLETGKDDSKMVREIGQALNKLHDSNAEMLPAAAAELISRARGLGYQALQGEPRFLGGEPADRSLVWDSEMRESYSTIGIIEPGDPVFVEDKPVIRDGEVIQKGVVRKVRRR